jgi:hypothetical protein
MFNYKKSDIIKIFTSKYKNFWIKGIKIRRINSFYLIPKAVVNYNKFMYWKINS